MKRLLLILAVLSMSAQAETVTQFNDQDFWDFRSALSKSAKFKLVDLNLYKSTDRVIRINNYNKTVTVWTQEEWLALEQQKQQQKQQQQQQEQQRRQAMAQRFDL